MIGFPFQKWSRGQEYRVDRVTIQVHMPTVRSCTRSGLYLRGTVVSGLFLPRRLMFVYRPLSSKKIIYPDILVHMLQKSWKERQHVFFIESHQKKIKKTVAGLLDGNDHHLVT
jgi:hypothetical protein